jgi:cytochrome c biogenesis factor
MVTWIWLGGIILMCGALIALWPQPPSARRELSAAYKARLAHELGRA